MKKSVLIGWGLGSFTTSVLINAVGLLHLRFMTDSLGIGVGLAGLMIALSKFYDAATDPVMGMISDQTRSRWGRHRPYLLVGGLLAAGSLVLLFNVPQQLAGAALIAFVAFALLVFSTAYTMFRIPYLAMGSTLTRDFRERSRLMTFSVYGSSIGGLFATSAAPFLLSRIGSDRAGHGLVACILAALIAAGALASFAMMKPAAETAPIRVRQRIAIGARLAALQENPPFLCLIGFKVMMFSGLALHGSAIPFYTRHVLHVSDASLGSIFLAQTLAMMASQIGWAALARRIGRRDALIFAALFQATAMVSWTLVPAGHPTPWIQIIGVCEGIGSGGLFFGLYTVLTDTMEHDRTRSGIEREGIFAGIFVMAEKITAAAGTVAFSTVLTMAGFVSARDAGAAAQPASVAQGIMIALAVLPAIAALLACLIMRSYRLPPAGDPETEVSQAPLSTKIAPGKALAVGLALLVAAPATAQPALAAVPATLLVKRLYAGPDGQSHIDRIELPRASGGDDRSIGARFYSTDLELGYSKPGSFIDWHGVSTPRFLIVLKGQLEIGLGDGSKHILKAGDIVFVTDMTGHGHTSRTIGAIPAMVLTVRLPKDDPLKIKTNPCPEGMATVDCVTRNVTVTEPR